MSKIIISSVLAFALLFLCQVSHSTTLSEGYFTDYPYKVGLFPNTKASGINFINKQNGFNSISLTFDNYINSNNFSQFSARKGNINNLSTWESYSLSNIINASNNNIKIEFNPIQNEWIEINYGSNYMYFGSLIGDSNYDSSLSPIDALSIINYINESGAMSYLEDYDINDDGQVSPSDVLIIINLLNDYASSDYPRLADGPFDPSSSGSISPTLFPRDTTTFDLFQPTGSFELVDGTIDFNSNENDLALIAGSNSGQLALAVIPKNDVPIPEPTTMLLLSAGLIGLAGLGRKKFFKKD